MKRKMRRIRAITVLSLAPLAGVSCGRISLMDNGTHTYPAIADLDVIDGGAPYCSALEV